MSHNRSLFLPNPHLRLTNHITAIINRIRQIYADSGDIKVLATAGIASIPPTEI